ncbi:MAG: NupC/NupG family nucleoside CNT transporter [Gemmatimonadota bacterium]|nr:NupC/NupG family nucleoside CNT transporter [Gemmatimonadota bacterium]MDH3369452.1 NupC/NupG family nucleoside CNT transporter [Gemmatimonadota bacterium]MDH3477440.1 NupC/NupG family nucleoside CNT transporter [Gemmatimonadota bacterium]MDH3571501.1 NupC/NupG family nucleoside CNT transporter [Gemmatimonadota bacterium]MDH5549078.1 NupC/NupG family nucleoside CNT transporter [Gemmatimonadota bacterium]
MGLVGMATMVAIAWTISTDRRKVNWRIVGIGVALQATFGFLVLKTGVGKALFSGANQVFIKLLGFTRDGAAFIFGNLVYNNVPVGVATRVPPESSPLEIAEMWANTGASFAFLVLPTIIFFSSLMSVLYHLGLMQRIVRAIAWVMQRTMGTSGAETLSVAGNIFVGQTESPLLIKPFVGTMTASELNTVMVGGFATIAGGVMAAYVGMLSPYFPDIAGHLLTASVMNAPAALLISKVLVPELATPVTMGSVKLEIAKQDANVIDAAASGAAQGLQLALNVGAMLLAFIALIHLIDFGVGALGNVVGLVDLSLQRIFGWVLAPLAWLMGVPWGDAGTVGSLIGVKTVVNEFVAYLQLAGTLDGGVGLSPRGAIIATYALLGFANFSSIAIQIGGIGGIAPERRSDLSRLGLRAMIGGNLAAFMSASLAGMLV